MEKRKLCSHCGHVGYSVTRVEGSLGIEILLWLCLAVPGIIYTIWRLTTRSQRCPVCDVDLPMLPIQSPRAQLLYRQLYPNGGPLDGEASGQLPR